MTTRRDLIKSGALLPLSTLISAPGTSWAADTRPRFLVDRRLPEARHLRRHAELAGCACADPGGEVIAFLTGSPEWLAPGAPIIGLTGYVDFALAGDVLRLGGRRMRQIWQIGPSAASLTDDGQRALLAALLGTPAAHARPGSTSFLWVA